MTYKESEELENNASKLERILKGINDIMLKKVNIHYF
jgi:hypothetical protein